MTGVLLAIALSVAVGWPLARVESSRSGRAGLAFLLGSGALAVVLLLFSLGGVVWSTTSIVSGMAVIGFAAAAFGRRFRPSSQQPLANPGPWSVPFLLFTLILVAGHALFATAGPMTDPDFLEIWGLNGRVFFESGAIDWAFLRGETTLHNHPDYPPLVPLLLAATAVFEGGWNDEASGLLFTAFGAALLLITEAALRRRFGGTWMGGAAVVALAPLALTPWLGIAEGPLVAFASAAMIYLWRGTPATGALLLGLAALTKNEGTAGIAAAAFALAVTSEGRRQVVRLWPAVVLAALWIVPRHVMGIEGDLTAGNPLARFLARLANPSEVLGPIAEHTPRRPLLWAGLALGAIAAGRQLFDRERILVAFVGFQLMVYLGAYAISPHDLAWHIRWSWERLVSHVTFLATAAVLMAVIARLSEKRNDGLKQDE